MEPFRYHVYICEQQKPDGAPCCAARGARRTIEALRAEIATRKLEDTVQVTACGSLGLCERGPNMVVYPEGVWYSGVTPEDVAEIVESHFAGGRPVTRLIHADAAALGGEIRGNRDRFQAAMRARDAAGVLPDELNQAIRGFMESRTILTALELDLFTALGGGATAEQAAAACGADARATGMLLNALASLGLVTKHEGVFRSTPAAVRFFTAGSPDDHRLALMHTARLWRCWSALTDVVRTGHAQPETRGEDDTRAFIAAMHRNAAGRAAQVALAVGSSGATRLLDVGGGSGAYAIAFARANPELRVEILDQAAVLRIAQTHIEEAGLAGRIATREGDLRGGSLGQGYDLVLLSAICHMLSEDENRDLLRRCHAALAPGGRLAIQDFLLTADKAGPRPGALFALNMLVNTPAGNSYSEQEYEGWLREAGFASVERIPLPGPTGVMVARHG